MSMTTLQAQLARRRTVTGRDQTQKREKTKASFLFEARKAADIDLETLHSIGLNGLGELTKLDGQFAAYHTTLFGFTGKLMAGREMLTREQNEKIDMSIDSFLGLVSRYFLLKPAHKVLEYLIRRYRIHEMNIDAILRCILPYHSTNVFARMVEILDLRRTKRWLFLQPVKDTGAPVDRQTLVAQCLKDYSLIDTICAMTEKAATDGVFYRTLGSFYGAMMGEIASRAGTITSPLVSRILPTVVAGLHQTSETDFRAAACLALSQLCVHAQLLDTVLESALTTLWKYTSPATLGESVGTMAIVCHTQAQACFPPTAFKYAVKLGGLVQAMKILALTKDVSAMLRLFGEQLLLHCASHTNYGKLLDSMLKEMSSHLLTIRMPLAAVMAPTGGTAPSPRGKSKSKKKAKAESKRAPAHHDEGFVDFITYAIVQMLHHCTAGHAKGAERDSHTPALALLQKILRHVAAAHPDRTDSAIAHVLRAGPKALPHAIEAGDSLSQEQFDAAVRAVLTEVYGGSQHEPIVSTMVGGSVAESSAPSTLALVLKNPQPEYRVQAITRLVGVATSPAANRSETFTDFVVQAGMKALMDPSPVVAIHALHPTTKLITLLPAEPVALLLLKQLRAYVDSPSAKRHENKAAESPDSDNVGSVVPAHAYAVLAVQVLGEMVAARPPSTGPTSVPVLSESMWSIVRNRLLTLLLEVLPMRAYHGALVVQLYKVAVNLAKKDISGLIAKFAEIDPALFQSKKGANDGKKKKKRGLAQADLEVLSVAGIDAMAKGVLHSLQSEPSGAIYEWVLLLVNASPDADDDDATCSCGLPRDANVRINLPATVSLLVVLRRALALCQAKSHQLAVLSRVLLHLSLLSWRILAYRQPSLIKDIAAAAATPTVSPAGLVTMLRACTLDPNEATDLLRPSEEAREHRVMGAVTMFCLRAAVRALPLEAHVSPKAPCSCASTKKHDALCATHLAGNDGSLAQLVADPTLPAMLGTHWIQSSQARRRAMETEMDISASASASAAASSDTGMSVDGDRSAEVCLAASCGGACHWQHHKPIAVTQDGPWVSLHVESAGAEGKAMCGSLGVGTLHTCLGSANERAPPSASSLLSRVLLWLVSVPHAGADEHAPSVSNTFGIGPWAGAYAGVLVDVLDRLQERMAIIPQLLAIVRGAGNVLSPSAVYCALRIATAWVRHPKTGKQGANFFRLATPIMMGPLMNSNQAIRRAGLDLLQSLVACRPTGPSKGELAFVQHLLDGRAAIQADASAVRRFVAAFVSQSAARSDGYQGVTPWLLTSAAAPPLFLGEENASIASNVAHAAAAVNMLSQVPSKHFFMNKDTATTVALGRLLSAMLFQGLEVLLHSSDHGHQLAEALIQRITSRDAVVSFGWHADRPRKDKAAAQISERLFDLLLDCMGASHMAAMAIPAVAPLPQRAQAAASHTSAAVFLDALTPGHLGRVFGKLVTVATVPQVTMPPTALAQPPAQSTASRLALEALKAFEPLDRRMVAGHIARLSGLALGSTATPTLPTAHEPVRVTAWSELLVVLELIQYEHISVDEASDPLSEALFVLLRTLSGMLRTAAAPSAAVVPAAATTSHGVDELDYAIQLILTGLRQHITSQPHEVVGDIDGSKYCAIHHIDAPLVVNCLHQSDNPQTHHDVVALVALLASRAPQRILQSLLDTFAVLGGSESGGVWESTIPAGTDTHWRTVLTQAIKAAVPFLAAMDPSAAPELAAETSMPRLLLVLAQSRAFPATLRIQLLVSFLTTLAKAAVPDRPDGLALVLAPAVMRLLEAARTERASDTAPMDIDGAGQGSQSFDVTSLSLGLFSAFSPLQQLQTVGTILQLLSDPELRNGSLVKMLAPGDGQFNLSSTNVLAFLDSVYASTQFGTHRALVEDQSLFDAALVAIKAAIVLLSRIQQESASHDAYEPESATASTAPEEHCSALLRGLSTLLPLQACLQAVSELITQQNVQVVHRALLLLQSLLASHIGERESKSASKKRRGAAAAMSTDDREQLVALVPHISSAISEALSLVSSQPTIAVGVIELGCEALGLVNQNVLLTELPSGVSEFVRTPWITVVAEQAVPILSQCLDVQGSERSDDIAIVSLRCLAGIFTALKAHMVPYINDILPTVLQLLARGQDICAFALVRSSSMWEAWRAGEVGPAPADTSESGMVRALTGSTDAVKVLNCPEGTSHRAFEHRAKVLVLVSLNVLEAFVSTLPQFVSAYIPALPLVARSDIRNRCDAVLTSLAHLVPARVFVPALIKAYPHQLAHQPFAPIGLPPPLGRLASAGAFGAIDSPSLPAEAVVALMSTFARTMQPATAANGTLSNGLEPSVVQSVTADVVALFKEALDYRRIHTTSLGIWPVGGLDVVENAVMSAAMNFIVKLTGDQFAPLFIQLGEWVLEDGPAPRPAVPKALRTALDELPDDDEWHTLAAEIGSVPRVIGLYRLTTALVQRLKSIFVPYCASALDHCVSLLEAAPQLSALCMPEDASSGGKRKKRRKHSRESDVSSDVADQADDTTRWTVGAYRAVRVLHAAVSFVHEVLLHDVEEEVGPERIERLTTALVALLEPHGIYSALKKASRGLLQSGRLPNTTTDLPTMYHDLVITPLLDCLAQLAVAARTDTMRKPLNYKTLMTTRHESAAVRFNAVRALKTYYSSMGEEWLVFLPESASFLSELLEDEDPSVEAETRLLVKAIESVLGESLQDHLQ